MAGPQATRTKRPTNLGTYAKKRDFKATPEPPPRATKVAGRVRAPSFVVHKHDATRLHYDLRLEMDGALASWAVPKGPSYDPKERRLAVQTEDHPLEYGRFEGRIPDGQYGAGDSLIWDRGTYETDPPGQASAMRKKGHIVFELDGDKLKGRWHLVRTRWEEGAKSQWLLFKSAKDPHARANYDVVAERPESVVSGKRVTRGPSRKGARSSRGSTALVKTGSSSRSFAPRRSSPRET
jgi:bifunctional non-homologous end joining protein LigD